MLALPDHFGPRLFSALQAPEQQGFAVWARVLSRWLLNARARPLAEGPFRVSVQLRVLPELRFGWGTIGPSAYSRPRDVIAEDNDDLVLFMNLGGPFLASHAGREIALASGDAYVMSCSELGSHARPAGGKLLCLRAHRAAIQPLVRRLDDKMGSVIPRDTESLRLLATYLRTVGGAKPLEDDAVRGLATQHVHGLLALALGAADGAGEAACAYGLRAARLKAAKALVRRHLAESHLSAEFIAWRLRISPRSVQRLFESEGMTFSGFVTGERLSRAYAALADVRKLHQGIAEIALDCGFGDLSYFNRKFRARYRASPSEVRHHEIADVSQSLR
jgi:AraC-like DNA-binding protein